MRTVTLRVYNMPFQRIRDCRNSTNSHIIWACMEESKHCSKLSCQDVMVNFWLWKENRTLRMEMRRVLTTWMFESLLCNPKWNSVENGIEFLAHEFRMKKQEDDSRWYSQHHEWRHCDFNRAYRRTTLFLKIAPVHLTDPAPPVTFPSGINVGVPSVVPFVSLSSQVEYENPLCSLKRLLQESNDREKLTKRPRQLQTRMDLDVRIQRTASSTIEELMIASVITSSFQWLKETQCSVLRYALERGESRVFKTFTYKNEFEKFAEELTNDLSILRIVIFVK